MANLNQIFAQIKELDIEEQRTLNKALVDLINTQHKQASAQAAMQFRIGEIVQFDAKNKGGITRIKITGFSRDLSKIKGDQVGGFRPGCQWTIGAKLATKVAA